MARGNDVEEQVRQVRHALFRLADMADVDRLEKTQELLDTAMDAMKDIEVYLIAKT